MERFYTKPFQEFASSKIILITGPRQSGKTTLTQFFSGSQTYLNYDSEEDRTIFGEKSWSRDTDFVIFDELHKMKHWKRWLKGIVDTEGYKPCPVVTGSARLDAYRKAGDSMAGRYFQYRVHPLDLRELSRVEKKFDAQKNLEKLLLYSGFPEPFLKGTQKFYNLWKKTHLDIILRQDIPDLENIRQIKSMEILIGLLAERVGSPLSVLSLSRELQCSDKTVKRWLEAFENMYMLFKITPFHKNIARANLKMPKYYFYDFVRVKNNGARLENLVACSLLKECHFKQDCLGENWELFYLNKRGGGEIDFVITKDGLPHTLLEVKLSEDKPSKNFAIIERDFPSHSNVIRKIQLVKNLKREKTYPNGIEIRRLKDWLLSW